MISRTAREYSEQEWRQFRPFQKSDRPPQPLVREARDVAAHIAHELIQKFGARKVVLFGSLATGNFHKGSDIDIAVWGIPPQSFYKAVGFANSRSVRWNVDLVDAEDCPYGLLQSILEEGVEP